MSGPPHDPGQRPLGARPGDLGYRCVVVPLDLGYEADRALPVGAAVAAQLGVELVTVTVTSPNVARVDDETEARAHARWAGVVIDEVVLRYGDDVAGEVLTETAEREGLLCIASHARGALADVVMHSVSAEIVSRGSGPVLLVGPRVAVAPPARFGSVLLCVDGPLPLAETIGAAKVWAGVLGVPVDVVEVTEAGVAPEAQSSARTIADHLDHRGVAVRATVLHGHSPAELLIEHAGQLTSPLLVMGTHSRRDHGPSALGAVSRAVVHRAPFPVLAVPPAPGES